MTYSLRTEKIGQKIWAMMSVGAHDPAEYADITIHELKKLAKRRCDPADAKIIVRFLENIRKD